MRNFKSLLRVSLALGLVSFGAACQQKPTKTVTELPILTEANQKQTQTWLQETLKQNPVILDARSPFDFNMAHVPTAINVRWEDFSQSDPHSRGLLDPDLTGLARRLALIGIDLDRKVLVLGKGIEGQGEDGRIAWTLKVLGVKNVYTMSYKELRSLKEQDTPPVLNKSYWTPEVDESLTVDFKLFKNLVTNQVPARAPVSKARASALGMPAAVVSRVTAATIFGVPLELATAKIVVLDARTPEQFSTENLKQKKEVQVPVVNIVWKEFFNEKGFVSEKVIAKLSAHNITKENIIYVISNNGVESAAATYALRTLGFEKSSNFAGGYEQWNVKK